jgi:hypothetical protein
MGINCPVIALALAVVASTLTLGAVTWYGTLRFGPGLFRRYPG